MNIVISAFKDQNYAQAYCLMRKIKGVVFVEGLKDVQFWRSIFNKATIREGINFKVYCASQGGTRSKDVLLNLMDSTSKYFTIAIDSDFDYICPNNNNKSQKINSNQYILQTYYHSKESVSYQPSCIHKKIMELSINRDIDFDIHSFLVEYSTIIHPALLRFLYLKDKGISGCSDKKFNSSIKTGVIHLDLNFRKKTTAFDKLKSNISSIVTSMNLLILDQLDLDRFDREIRKKGLTEKTSHLYIKGHILEDSIITPIYNSIMKSAKANEVDLIKKELVGIANSNELLENRINEIKSFYDSFNLENLMSTDEERLKTTIVRKIVRDISGMI